VNILVLNAGSSTLKFELIDTDPARIAGDADDRLARGRLEWTGGDATVTVAAGDGPPSRSTERLQDVRAALDFILRWACSPVSGVEAIRDTRDIEAVGHRVVHGGERFTRSTLVTDEVLRGIEECALMAPLHNTANLQGILAAREIFGPGVPQVAVFDTAFHQTLPECAYLYALPYRLYQRHGIRRYGFHGTSHRFVAFRYRQLLGLPRERATLVTLHLGNGSSVAAIRGGASVDTSMGFTPLEGLVMGTRSGDLDPGVVAIIGAREGLSAREVEDVLNHESGLLGISGLTHDMRGLLEAAGERADQRARLAIEIFCYRARKYVGAYLAAMGGADAIVFTGGIGENAPEVRARICAGLEWMGLDLDPARNEAVREGLEGRISADGSRLAAWVIPTDEELLIARDTVGCVCGHGGPD
jgi:acetate kinase